MSVVHKANGKTDSLAWQGVALRDYGKEGFEGVTRQVVIGPEDGSTNFAIRYFRVEPGCSTSLDQHEHEHGVVIVHGRARLQLKDTFQELETWDAIYISGNDVHQLTCISDTPMGFLCVIKPHFTPRGT